MLSRAGTFSELTDGSRVGGLSHEKGIAISVSFFFEVTGLTISSEPDVFLIEVAADAVISSNRGSVGPGTVYVI